MPKPLSDAAETLLLKLLRNGKSAVAVAQQMAARWPVVTPQRVRLEAYKHGIQLAIGRRQGSKAPGVGGRPKGTFRSPYRARVMQLRGDGYSLRAIANLITVESGKSMSAENVRRILKTAEDSTDGENEKLE